MLVLMAKCPYLQTIACDPIKLSHFLPLNYYEGKKLKTFARDYRQMTVNVSIIQATGGGWSEACVFSIISQVNHSGLSL
jgi:hypothetical protein